MKEEEKQRRRKRKGGTRYGTDEGRCVRDENAR